MKMRTRRRLYSANVKLHRWILPNFRHDRAAASMLNALIRANKALQEACGLTTLCLTPEGESRFYAEAMNSGTAAMLARMVDGRARLERIDPFLPYVDPRRTA